MRHLLSIKRLYDVDDHGNKLWQHITGVIAETNLDAAPLYPFPEFFEGKLIGVPVEEKLLELAEEELSDFRFSPGVEIDFLGNTYKFKRLEEDGTFEIYRNW